MNYKTTTKLDHHTDVELSKYTKVSLAYFDMLGFSQYLRISCAETPRAMLQVFYEILTSIENEFHISTETTLKYKVVSDGFILWFNSQDDEYFARLIQITYFTRRYLNKECFLVRGGIVKGDHYLNGDIMVSPALVKAVTLEKCAQLPKIIIEKEEAISLREKVLGNFEVHGEDKIWLSEKGEYLRFEREYIVEDEVGNLVLHPVHGVQLSAIKRETRPGEIQNCVALFKNYRDHLEKNWNLNRNASGSIRSKFEYIISELNKYIELHQDDIPQEWKIQYC